VERKKRTLKKWCDHISETYMVECVLARPNRISAYYD